MYFQYLVMHKYIERIIFHSIISMHVELLKTNDTTKPFCKN